MIVKHFMLAPGQQGCVGCSFEVDHIGGALLHLAHHDVTYVAVARAPLEEIEDFKKRMGWTFKWVFSCARDCKYDLDVSFTPGEIASSEAYYNYERRRLPVEDVSGHSVFHKNAGGDIFHT